jgi:type II secretory pathway pseudopilin PulG
MNTSRAFTLLEMTAVLVLVLVLAGLAVPTYRTVLGESRSQITVASARAYRDSIDAYAAAQQLPPDQLSAEFFSAGGLLADELPGNATSSIDSGVVTLRLEFGSDDRCAEITLATSVGGSSLVGAVSCPSPPPPSPPGVPVNLVATSRNAKVLLTWDAPSPGTAPIEDYRIEYSVGEDWVLVADGVSTSTSFTVTDLANDVLHAFRVTALNAVGAGSPATAAATPALEWQFVTAAGGPANDATYASALADDGGVLIAGQFRESVTFGTTTLSAWGCPTVCTGAEIFVAKLDAAGTWLWAQRAGGVLSESARGIVAAPDGGAYVVGEFSANTGGAFFPTSSGSITLANAGSSDLFVAKISADGFWQWAHRAGSSGVDAAYAVAAHPNGVVLTGRFSGSDVAFGSSITRSSSGGSSDIVVAHLSDVGDWVWVASAGGTSTDDYGEEVAVLSDGDVVVVGRFATTATFGAFSRTAVGSTDAFVARLDGVSGTWEWVTTAGSSATDTAAGVAVGGEVIHVVGAAGDGAVFGSFTASSDGSNDAFYATIDPSGVWQSLQTFGGAGSAAALGVFATADGGVVLTGVFSGTVLFGPTSLTSAGGTDLFVAEISPLGSWRWATRAGGSGTDFAYSAQVTSDGGVQVVGYFESTATFGEFSRTSSGVSDLFVGRIAP